MLDYISYDTDIIKLFNDGDVQIILAKTHIRKQNYTPDNLKFKTKILLDSML